MVFGFQKPKLAAHISDYMMITGLIRGNLNRQADGNPELGINSECRDFIPGIF